MIYQNRISHVPPRLQLIRLASAIPTSPRQNETAILAKRDRAVCISGELTSQVVVAHKLPEILVQFLLARSSLSIRFQLAEQNNAE